MQQVSFLQFFCHDYWYFNINWNLLWYLLSYYILFWIRTNTSWIYILWRTDYRVVFQLNNILIIKKYTETSKIVRIELHCTILIPLILRCFEQGTCIYWCGWIFKGISSLFPASLYSEQLEGLCKHFRYLSSDGSKTQVHNSKRTGNKHVPWLPADPLFSPYLETLVLPLTWQPPHIWPCN